MTKDQVTLILAYWNYDQYTNEKAEMLIESTSEVEDTTPNTLDLTKTQG